MKKHIKELEHIFEKSNKLFIRKMPCCLSRKYLRELYVVL